MRQSFINLISTNSPLLSDNIYDIEINDKTGEVFIGTDKGLNSYQGEASEGKSDYSEIYAILIRYVPNIWIK